LFRGIATKQDLAFSHIQQDYSSKLYIAKKLNVSLVQTRKNQRFNAKQLISNYTQSIGECTVSQVHLSSKSEYETRDGSQRMAKELFSNLA
jgi:hypothetical protein